MMGTRLEFTLGLALNILMLLAPTSGLFDASLESTRMKFKNDTSFINSNGLKIKKVNRVYVLTGTLELFEDTGNEYQIISYFLKKAGNEYRRMPYKIGPYKFCQYFDEEKYFIESMRKKSDFPPKGTCPWPKKIYTINGYEVDLSNIPPVVSSGDYMMETQFLKDGILLNAMQFFGKVEYV